MRRKKIKVYTGDDLMNLQSDEYQPLDVGNTYLCWAKEGEGMDIHDRNRVAKAIKFQDLIDLILK